MAEFLTWREGWQVGIERIDADHRELLRLLNLLARARERLGAAPALVEGLQAIIAHLRRHFEFEESLLREIRYPDYDRHARAHALELAELVSMQRAVMSRGAHALDTLALQGIKDWFCDHVVAEDRRYAAFYFQSRPAGAPSAPPEEDSPGLPPPVRPRSWD
jgi:hemerythrin